MNPNDLTSVIVPIVIIIVNIALILRIKTDMKLASFKEELRK
jgi:hypothetical protein